MKVLIISHAYAERDNHKKLEELAKISGLEIGVVYPNFWRTWHGEEKCHHSTKAQDDPEKGRTGQIYSEFPLGTFFSGDGGEYFYGPLEILTVFKKFKPDLVHLEEEPFTPVAFEVVFFARLLEIKLIFFTWENIDIPLGIWRNLIEKFVFKFSLAALAGNLGARERIFQRGFKRGITLIPQFGVDPDLFRPGSCADKLSQQWPFTVGFVGRPSEAKGLDLLFKAFSKLDTVTRLLVVSSATHLPNWLLDLSGSLGIGERVEFCLGVAHRNLPEYFRRMDVFVLPSRTTTTWKEQFGRTLVEAMASGVPVVGSSSGAIPEVVGKVGLVFREGDSEDLRRCLKLLMNDKNLRHGMSDRGLEAVSEIYSFGKMAQKTAQFYFDNSLVS